ncbi:MAG TPA: hypothetical protein VL967_07645 [Terracidiphilus sp.]|nr:hypothetical protein [Terracidiphilus sp.]
MMDALEVNCPVCSRCMVLSDRIPEFSGADADRYARVPLDCSVNDGGECGWKGYLLLSECTVVQEAALGQRH